MKSDTTFAERLRALRAAAHMSLGDLADASGLSRPYLSQLESGQRQPSWETVQSLCAALGCSSETFREDGNE